VADYVREITTRLEAPMRSLFVYRKTHLHGMEVHDCLHGDQGLSPKWLLSVTDSEMQGKGVLLSRQGQKDDPESRVKDSGRNLVWARINWLPDQTNDPADLPGLH
jgi:hypothetical protein